MWCGCSGILLKAFNQKNKQKIRARLKLIRIPNLYLNLNYKHLIFLPGVASFHLFMEI